MDFNALTEQILTEAAALPTLDIIVTVTAILYLILATRENIWCWFFGIISCALWGYVAYFDYNLQIEALLQIFYVGMSSYGIHQWKYGSKNKEELPITRMSVREHGGLIVIGFLVTILVGSLYANYSDTSFPYVDSFTTIFSVLITFLVIYKKLENWLYWIVIDAVYVWLYWQKGAYLFSVLFVVYVVIAFLGWLEWRGKVRAKGIDIS